MRDHRRVLAFQMADRLALEIYRVTAHFPKEETYGLQAQIRRAAVSTASNIVEGASRHTDADYLRFLDIALGSANEAGYQLSLAHRLGYLPAAEYLPLQANSTETCRVLYGLIRSIRKQAPGS